MSCSVLVSTSNERSRSSREQSDARCFRRSRSPSAATSASSARERIDRQDQQVARRARELAAEQPQVVAALDGALDQRKRRRRVLGGDRVEHVEHEVAPDQPSTVTTSST